MAQGYFPSFNISFRGADGQPLSLGKVYFFLPDGVTPAATYNQNGQANAHPVVLGLDGEAQLKGDDTISYTVKSYTAANALVDTWTGVYIPSGGSGSTVTMDTIAQGTNYKKVSTSQYNALTSGGATTLHYHSADRAWSNITGKPSTFTPSAHASTHANGGSDALAHDSTGPDGVGQAVSFGHISDAAQSVYGEKTFEGKIIAQAGFQSNSTDGNTQIDGSTLFQESADFSHYANIVTTGSQASSTLTANNGNDSITNYVTTNGAVQTIKAGDCQIESHSYNGSNSSITLDAPEGRRITIIAWADALSSSIRIEGKGGASLNTYVMDSGDIFLEAVSVTTTAEYRYPETVSGSYNIATREWVATTYGNAAQAFNFTQGTASAVWTINHGLNYKPIVQAWDSTGAVINGSIQHVSNTQLTITFSSSQSGGARCI